MMMEAPKLVRRLLALSTSSCHCEWRSMIRPIGPILLRGRLAVAVLSGGVSSRLYHTPVVHPDSYISRM
jgi:hypothetical protein